MAHKLVKVLLITLGILVLLLGSAYLFRDPLATRITAFMLDRNEEMTCSHPKVHISSSLKRVTLSPFECENHASGALKFFSADSAVELQLDGTEVTHIHVAKATMEQRDRKTTNVESNMLGDIANIVGIRDGLMKGMLDASEGFSPGGPVMTVDTMIAKRNGKLESVMKGFRRTYEDGFERQHAARMEGKNGDEAIAMRDFDMRVNKSEGKLSLALHFGKPERGEKPDMKLEMEARGLDEKTPKVRMSL
jgi:hypothetical protein